MSEMRYDVVFEGELLDGFDLHTAKDNLAQLLKQGEEKIEEAFNARRIIFKSNLEPSAAQKYQQILGRAGLQVALQPSQGDGVQGASVDSTAAVTTSAADTVAESGTMNSPKLPLVDNAQPHSDIEPRSDGELQQNQEAPPAPPVTHRASPGESVDSRNLPFKFNGNGAEYFKIWIVNIFLTVVTLGIYSAWAKVRNKRYFYSNTELDGNSFEYLAKPLQILKGRVIAVGFFLLVGLTQQIAPQIGAVLGLLLLAAFPWLAVRSLAFNAYNSAYRNLRFGFRGKLGGAVMTFIGWPILGALTLGLLMPMAFYKQQQYMVTNYCYGTCGFGFRAKIKDYFVLFLMLIAIVFVGGIVAGLLGTIHPVVSGLAMVLVYLYLFAYSAVKFKNIAHNNASLGPHNLRANLKVGSFLLLFVSNTLLTVITLGLYHPWAKVRTAHYMADHMGMTALGDLDRFVASEQEQVSALGEELGEVFDFDIGL